MEYLDRPLVIGYSKIDFNFNFFFYILAKSLKKMFKNLSWMNMRVLNLLQILHGFIEIPHV